MGLRSLHNRPGFSILPPVTRAPAAAGALAPGPGRYGPALPRPAGCERVT
jgi:hypothetical protein